MKNTNTVNLLAKSNNRENHTRSNLLIISIVLTTMLLTVIGVVVNIGIETSRANAGHDYGEFYGSFRRIDEEQLNTMKLRNEFTDIGIQVCLGMVQSEDADMFLFYTDETTLDMMYALEALSEGNYPEKENEITAYRAFFQLLGYSDPQIGQEIVLQSRLDEGHRYEEQTFRIAGFLTDPETYQNNSIYSAFVSEDYYEQHKNANTTLTAYFNLADTVDITASNAEEKIEELAVTCGIQPENADDNYVYILWTKDPGRDTIAGAILIALVVILFSIIVIYNIFQVGIVQKIQEYGKIKALGATRKQMRQLIFREGILLAMKAIPIGLILGNLVSCGFFAYEEQFAKTKLEGHMIVNLVWKSIPIEIGVIILVVITVYLALRRPMRIVSHVSPVQAIQYQENSSDRIGIRKGKQSLDVIGITIANIKNHKKRTVMTIITMGLSCILFVVLSNLTCNMDITYQARQDMEYGQFCIEMDYSLNDSAYPENNLYNIQKNYPINDEFIHQVKAIPEVTKIWSRDVICVANPQDEMRTMSIGIINKEELERIKKEDPWVGNLDYETMSAHNGIAYGSRYWFSKSGFAIGDSMNLQIRGVDENLEIPVCVDGAVGMFDQDWTMTEDTFEALGLQGNYTTILWVDCKKEDVAAVEKKLEELLQFEDKLELTTYHEVYASWDTAMKLVTVGTNAFLVVLGIIGFMNLANTMVTSIITRKRELGILQAIGMTNRQLNHMLQMEGLLFTIGTMIVAVGVGSPLGYATFHYAKNHGIVGLNQYHFPWIAVLGMILVIGLLQSVLSFFLSKNLRKASLVERIQYLG